MVGEWEESAGIHQPRSKILKSTSERKKMVVKEDTWLVTDSKNRIPTSAFFTYNLLHKVAVVKKNVVIYFSGIVILCIKQSSH